MPDETWLSVYCLPCWQAWVLLLAMLHVLEDHDPEDLRRLASLLTALPRAGPRNDSDPA